MQKLEITVVVPERIAALVQDYLQNWILVGGNSGFMSHLLINEVENPEQFLPEMEIGIKHPDDEPVKIYSVLESEHKEVLEYLQEYIGPTYFDSEIGEHLYCTSRLSDHLSDGVFWAPIEVVEFIESVKATDCCYFSFQKY
jgi:hypothetical protein